MDLDLLETIARERPEWNFVIIGPVVKIDPSILPVLPNIHYLGSKSYEELPTYLAGWDIAMMPFAINESTKFISPTKTPEYLAGGKPVVSTPIKDVVTPYGDNGLVYIASSAEEFIKGIEQELNMPDKDKWLKAVDAFLEKNSWEKTVEKMLYHINTKIESNQQNNLIQKENEYV
jgi:glycosyltransferase involved in cell wall biosynthesis